ncbi:hypothetical protein [Geodermatophilus marinus]|uniref:hypothetical protein n=1 Tax=Geodermatophilus sp. LHW52908 TaxID=2303986 RepID=UPI000E3B8F5F|nr:hypothetical protein [Geodermatophilus sp. LHW52908]RFU21563.1 hypothetical protein D0Z06_10190 [Geodermatophilus sp. LHW52908]
MRTGRRVRPAGAARPAPRPVEAPRAGRLPAPRPADDEVLAALRDDLERDDPSFRRAGQRLVRDRCRRMLAAVVTGWIAAVALAFALGPRAVALLAVLVLGVPLLVAGARRGDDVPRERPPGGG